MKDNFYHDFGKEAYRLDRIQDINIIKEFSSEHGTFGVYSVIFNGEQKIFIRNGNSIGAVVHYVGEPVSKCVSEIRNDVKEEFLGKLL